MMKNIEQSEGYREIFEELEREAIEEEAELREEYIAEITEKVSKIKDTDILAYIHIIVSDIIGEEVGA